MYTFDIICVSWVFEESSHEIIDIETGTSKQHHRPFTDIGDTKWQYLHVFKFQKYAAVITLHNSYQDRKPRGVRNNRIVKA
ncbi:predicted protein [Sclerotinia sclerotiorum 1980 UF-70]|uniref:Uncharacterized protein n=1 Tax=Sclerotinia sclerotiorum (strain ATCC 18683 / 1980 / Ss-1) TaxID=665079 RepID=A7E4W6_SCLS1|nr:predicted protein [Sclerotinia sclerotiorum 1980 UF-70]EDN90938.1 predicted protein [Sclerotinia sclerotiorum 1980 UF-70]